MNILQKLQQKYIEEFSNNTPIDEFLLNLLICALLISILKWYYTRYATVISNRHKFSVNFLPLALATFLVIMIVKSSIALSLGLVGALSIVRFRAAIKEPEELTYLFIAIGIGLATGANQPLLAILTFTIILCLLFLHQRFFSQKQLRQDNKIFVNIHTDSGDLKQISEIISGILPYVALKRMDSRKDGGLDLSFICQAETIDQLENLKNQVLSISPATSMSVVEAPELAL